MDDRCRRGVLSEVLGLVSTQQSLGLDLWSWSTGKFLVEADYTGHACGILSGTKSLILLLAAALFVHLMVGSSGCAIRYQNQSTPFRKAGEDSRMERRPIDQLVLLSSRIREYRVKRTLGGMRVERALRVM